MTVKIQMQATHQRQDDIFILLDDNLSGRGSVLFANPLEIISCTDPNDVSETLNRLEECRKYGRHLAGYFSYELGYVLEDKLIPLLPPPDKRAVPLIWFGVFENPVALSPSETDAFLAQKRSGDYQLTDLTPTEEEGPYCDKIGKVLNYIEAGDTYQVNYTFKHKFKLSGDPIALFQELRQRQNVARGAYLETGEHSILSLSPEVFLTAKEKTLRTRPMKGTAPRGETPTKDAENKVWLTQDEKSRAENLMIVDLLRNDMSKVCIPGSVKVTDLFHVETYQSLFQMTSNIVGKLQDGITPADLIRQLFPCGSITGAPKIRTMEIIHELEAEPRGIYTGSIGHIAPNGDCSFNVAIRTLVIDKAGRGEMGIGSGIVYDSNPAAEYQESLLKGQFLSGNRAGCAKPDFDLIETFRWEEGTGFHLLAEHLQRLEYSAGFFGYPCDIASITGQLMAKEATGLQRVRLLLHKDGSTSLTNTSIHQADVAKEINFALAEKPVDSSNIFLQHKTTLREFFEDELARQNRSTGCDEVLFFNERGELTEGARTNLFIEKAGILYTPPLNCGLLNGTLRRQLLAQNYKNLSEKILTRVDLEDADVIYFGNSVRDLMPATMIAE